MKSTHYDFISDQLGGHFLKAWAVSTLGAAESGIDDSLAAYACFDGALGGLPS